MKRAIYPGSFDPITNGHLDIIKRARGIFDELIVAILVNREKKPMFSTQERVELIKKSVAGMSGVKVDCFKGLLVDYMRGKNIKVAIRGLRAVSDLEYEFQMANTNRILSPGIETVFLMPGAPYAYLTSTVVRDVASLGGELKEYVPPHVISALRKKCSK
ncbi:MAG: pantetheine-phosphate adenylyltransferase [Elusimicrobia bacterium]|nr:pantetheine-phosphate adenylyltransferase [Elusimicrobiota bacterium]